MPPLDGAFAFPKVYDIAVSITDDLDLDVPRTFDQLLNVDRAVAKRARGAGGEGIDTALSLSIGRGSGLAIAIGEVVDDAVIDVENILRRLRENRDKDNPQPVFRSRSLPFTKHEVFGQSVSPMAQITRSERPMFGIGGKL